MRAFDAKGRDCVIIEDICVEGFGTLRNKLTLTGLSDGINVVYGPNEIGKSTLMNALVSGVFEKYNTKGNAVRSYVPWGTSINPKVQIVFVSGGNRYKLEKQFLQGAYVRLYEDKSGQFLSLADGDAAEKKLRKLVGADEEDTKDKGLTQLLWVPQGYKTFAPLQQTATTLIESVLGGQVTSPLDREIIASVQKEYDGFYGKRQTFKKDSGIPDIEKEINRLKAELELANGELATINQLSNDVTKQELQLQEYRQQLVTAQAEKERVEAALQELREKMSKTENAALVLNDAMRRAEDEDKRNKTILDLRAQVSQLQQETKVDEQNLVVAKNNIDIAEHAIRNLRDRITQAEGQIEAQNMLMQLTSKRKRVKELEQQIARWDKEAATQVELFSRLEELNVPDQETWSNIVHIKQRFDALKSALDTVTSELKFESLTDGLGISVYPNGGTLTLHQHERHTWDVGNAFSLTIDGIGTITLTATGKRDILHDFDALKRELESTLATYGRTYAVLADDMETAQQLMRDIALSKGTQKGISSSGLDEVNIELRSILASIHPGQKEVFENLDPSGLPHIEQEMEQLRELLSTYKQTKDKREEEAKEERTREQNLKLKIARDKQSVSSMQTRLTELEANESDEDRLARLKTLEVEVRKATEAYEALQVPDDEVKRIEAWSDSSSTLVKNLASAERSAEITLKQIEMKFDQAISRGWYSKKTLIEEELDVKIAEYNEKKSYAEGVKYLFETLESHMNQTVQSFIGPVASRVAQKLQQISGSRYDMVQFADGFSPADIRLSGRSETVTTDSLSDGMKEQLSLLVRLTLGEIVSGQEKQLVVLDDPLVNTDPWRLQMTLQWLTEASKSMQIIILTCHQQEYQRIAANFCNMEQLKTSAS